MENSSLSFCKKKKNIDGENGYAIFTGQQTKEAEKEHYNFLNQMRVKLGVDSQKLIDLEARITCKYFKRRHTRF